MRHFWKIELLFNLLKCKHYIVICHHCKFLNCELYFKNPAYIFQVPRKRKVTHQPWFSQWTKIPSDPIAKCTCILSRTTPPARNVPSTPCLGWGKSRMFRTTMVDGNWTGTNTTWKGGWPVETPKGWWGWHSLPVTARSTIHLPEVTLTSEVTRVRSVCLFFNLFVTFDLCYSWWWWRKRK